MPRAFVFLALFVLAPGAAGQETLRIEGLTGRVETLGTSERVELLTGLGPRDCPGPGLLEAGSMAKARLFWPARASLMTQGRAGLEWRGGGAVFLRVFELQHGELEVRRGPLVLELPWNWNASFESGAYRLRTLPGGTLEIETVAGSAPRVWWSRAGLMRPFQGPSCGERVQLPQGWSPKLVGAPEDHAPWSQVSWPWGEVRQAEGLHVTVEAPVELPLELPRTPEPTPEPPRVELPPFDAQLWHGFAREQLQLAGPVAIERREDLAVERSEAGGWTLRLRSDAPRAAWVLREGSDLELAPGTVVVLDAKGALVANLGPIKSEAHAAGRPAPLQSGIAPRP